MKDWLFRSVQCYQTHIKNLKFATRNPWPHTCLALVSISNPVLRAWQWIDPRIYVLICVGLAVDYAAHIAHMFKDRSNWKVPTKRNEILVASDSTMVRYSRVQLYWCVYILVVIGLLVPTLTKPARMRCNRYLLVGCFDTINSVKVCVQVECTLFVSP